MFNYELRAEIQVFFFLVFLRSHRFTIHTDERITVGRCWWWRSTHASKSDICEMNIGFSRSDRDLCSLPQLALSYASDPSTSTVRFPTTEIELSFSLCRDCCISLACPCHATTIIVRHTTLPLPSTVCRITEPKSQLGSVQNQSMDGPILAPHRDVRTPHEQRWLFHWDILRNAATTVKKISKKLIETVFLFETFIFVGKF